MVKDVEEKRKESMDKLRPFYISAPDPGHGSLAASFPQTAALQFPSQDTKTFLAHPAAGRSSRCLSTVTST